MGAGGMEEAKKKGDRCKQQMEKGRGEIETWGVKERRNKNRRNGQTVDICRRGRMKGKRDITERKNGK